jgi:hypothetical protein
MFGAAESVVGQTAYARSPHTLGQARTLKEARASRDTGMLTRGADDWSDFYLGGMRHHSMKEAGLGRLAHDAFCGTEHPG